MVVVLESVPSLQTLSKEQVEKIDGPIPLIADKLHPSKNIHYTGWDHEESVANVMQKKRRLIKPFQEELAPLYKELAELRITLDEMMIETNRCFFEMDRIAAGLGIPKKCIDFSSGKDYVLYIKNFFKNPSLEQKQQLDILTNIYFSVPMVDSSIYDRIEQLQGAIKIIENVCVIADMNSGIGEQWIEETLPMRRKKMQITLSKMNQYISKNLGLTDAKIVLIAGVGHFKIVCEEIKKHKAAIFIPSIDSTP